MSDHPPAKRRGGIPRGVSTTGPVLFSYGFRPFFLAAGVWAIATMMIWIGILVGWLDIAASYGPNYWHAHEMIFGFASAVLAGFLMTSIPNWTGRLPVSGWPLIYLLLVWTAGRLLFLLSDQVGQAFAVIADSVFLPLFLSVCLREIIAGKKWKDLKVILGLSALALANIAYHTAVLNGRAPLVETRLALSAYIFMILIVGGRIIPSFTHNWLAKRGTTRLPVAYNRFDTIAITSAVIALASWIVTPEGRPVAILAGLAAAMHAARLWRWRGWRTAAEPLVAILHVAYLFIPLGFAAICLSGLNWLDEVSAIHIISVGTIATMMLAVMTRIIRGHTGRVLTASAATSACYIAILLAALIRPSAQFFPDHISTVYVLAGSAWIAAFAIFVAEYGPMLTKIRRPK